MYRVDYSDISFLKSLPIKRTARKARQRGYRRFLPSVFTTLHLHPMLGREAAEALEEALEGLKQLKGNTRTELMQNLEALPCHQVFEDQAVIQAEGEAKDTIWIIVSGGVRAVGRSGYERIQMSHDGQDGDPPSRILASYRDGQWLNIPVLVQRAINAKDRKPTYQLQAQGRTGLLALPIDTALALFEAHQQIASFMVVQAFHRTRVHMEWVPLLTAYLGAHMSQRLNQREDWMSMFEEHPLLSLLDQSDKELLIQLSSMHFYEETGHLPKGQLERSVRFFLRGGGQSYAPSDEKTTSALVNAFKEGHLTGYQLIATAQELSHIDDPRNDSDPLAEVYPRQATDTFIRKGSMVMEIDWLAFRWMMYEKDHVWAQLCAFLKPGRVILPSKNPPIYAFYGSREGLGTTTLAHSTAVAMARAIYADQISTATRDTTLEFQRGPRVALVDPEHQGHLKCTLDDGTSPPEAWTVGSVVAGDADDFNYKTHTVEVDEGTDILMAWCEDPNDTEKLVRVLRQRGQVDYILVSDNLLMDEDRTSRANRLVAMGAAVIWVTDEPLTPYNLTAKPVTYIRAERLTPAYVRSEVKVAKQVIEGKFMRSGRPQPEVARHVLRVPEDAAGHKAFLTTPPNEFFSPRPNGRRPPLADTSERLARMLRGRSVGVALGGGGAWGFTQVALIRALEAEGLPIDYVTGTSFGSVVAGLYAAGGQAALDRLLDWSKPLELTDDPRYQSFVKVFGWLNKASKMTNSGWEKVFKDSAMRTWRDAFSSRLNVGIVNSIPNSTQLQVLFDDILAELIQDKRFKDEVLSRASWDPMVDEGLIPLTTTHIPFLPIGTSLDQNSAVVEYQGTVGHGVRSASCLPPVFSSLWSNNDSLIDGAMVAFVPAEKAREWGADFVVACNVIPPSPDFEPPPEEPPVKLHDKADRLIGELSQRIYNIIHGLYLMSWKAGHDQGKLKADYIVDMRPKGFEVYEYWKGVEIYEHYKGVIAARNTASRIKALWDTQSDWDPGEAYHENVDRDEVYDHDKDCSMAMEVAAGLRAQSKRQR